MAGQRTFEWDAAKAARNLAKHGVPFESAAMVFADASMLAWADVRRDYGEDRFIAVGRGGGAGILSVVFATRGAETRIISARQASRKERKLYGDR